MVKLVAEPIGMPERKLQGCMLNVGMEFQRLRTNKIKELVRKRGAIRLDKRRRAQLRDHVQKHVVGAASIKKNLPSHQHSSRDQILQCFQTLLNSASYPQPGSTPTPSSATLHL